MRTNSKSLEVGMAVNKLLEGIIDCYPIIADKGANYPYLVYRRTGLGEELTKDRRCDGYTEYATVELILVAVKYRESIELAQKIKDKLEQSRGEIDDIKIRNIVMINSSENWANDAYLQSLTMRIEIEK